MAVPEQGALLVRFRVHPPEAKVSIGCSGSTKLIGRVFRSGRFMHHVPIHSEMIVVEVGIPEKGQDGDVYVEDAVYHIHTDSLVPKTPVVPTAIVRASDTEHQIIVRSRLTAVLESPQTFVAARDAAMDAYNAACNDELGALGIEGMPDGEQTFVVLTDHGLAPMIFPNIPRARFSKGFAERLLHLMCNLDQDQTITPATLYNHPDPRVRRRVLARCALVGCSVRYVPDAAMTTHGLEIANLFSSPVLSGDDDCEGCTLMTWWAWCALRAAYIGVATNVGQKIRWVLDAYVFYVVVCSFRSGNQTMQHMCAVLMPVDRVVDENAILLESTTRTCGDLRTHGQFTTPPAGYERDLVARDGLVNDWYKQVYLMYNPMKPEEPLVPYVKDTAGVSMETLLRRPHSVTLVPMRTQPPPEITRMLRRRFEDDPVPDLGIYDVLLSDIRGPDAGAHHILTTQSGQGFRPVDNAIRTGPDSYYAFRASLY